VHGRRQAAFQEHRLKRDAKEKKKLS
jgi:hypothetical protein